jgi:arylsulfatase A-like enzyme
VKNNARAFEPVYAGVVETIDDTVGRLMSTLERLHLADRTIVVFTSDNGGLHVPEGPHPKITHNTPFRAGKGFVYEGGLRIPLIVRWPGHVPAGKIADEPVINTDWVPTLVDFAGLPPVTGLDGVSLAKFLTGTEPAPKRPFFWHFPHYTNQGSRPTGAMRQQNWMLVEFYDEGAPELYDLNADVRQQHNVASQHEDRVRRMRLALAAWRLQVDAQDNRPNPDFDAVQFKRLYGEMDPSRFDPLDATSEQWQQAWSWRKAMNSVLPGARKNQANSKKR